jgi:hypothetical protein
MTLLVLASLVVAAPNDGPFDLGLGVCLSGKSPVVRLEELPIFDAPRVDLARFGIAVIARVEDETLLLEREDKVTRFYRVDRLVAGDAGTDFDVDTKIGLLDNRPVIVWRETFKHRPARFGVMTIGWEKLKPVCEGTTGSPMIE